MPTNPTSPPSVPPHVERLLLLPLFVLPVLWLAGYFFPPINHDVAAILDVSARWVHGERLYVEIIDENLPLTFVVANEYAPLRIRARMVASMACGFAIGAALGGLLTPLGAGAFAAPIAANLKFRSAPDSVIEYTVNGAAAGDSWKQLLVAHNPIPRRSRSHCLLGFGRLLCRERRPA